jgi:hypothetical protein
MKYRNFIGIFIFINGLAGSDSFSQNLIPLGIRLARITYLTSNLDSLTRSFLKKGFRISQGKRDPIGVFNNFITLEDKTQIILETTNSKDSTDWRIQILKNYGNHISGIAFEVNQIDSFYQILRSDSIPLSPVERFNNSDRSSNIYFALDSVLPLDVVFFQKDSLIKPLQEKDSLSNHPNHVFRIDWMLLSADSSNHRNIRKVFEAVAALQLHQGCCDYFRVGPSDDFCFFRFDPLPQKAKGKNNWLSIETDGIYFAY